MGSWNLRRDVQQLYFNAHYWKQMFLSIPFVCSPLEITGCWNFKLFQGRNSILCLFLLCVYKNIRNSLLDETRDPSCSPSLIVPIENIICGEHMHGVACTPFSALFAPRAKGYLESSALFHFKQALQVGQSYSLLTSRLGQLFHSLHPESLSSGLQSSISGGCYGI